MKKNLDMIRLLITGMIFLFCAGETMGQDMIKSYLIQVEDGKAYLDVTKEKAQVGDVFSIKKDVGYMIHP